MKKSIFILSVIFCVACQKVDDVHNKNADQRGTNEEVVTGNQEYIKIGNEATSKIATIVHQKR